MWDKLKENWANGLLVFLAVFYLAHLVAIKLLGVVTIGEGSDLILWIEIVLMLGIAILGIERLIKDWRK